MFCQSTCCLSLVSNLSALSILICIWGLVWVWLLVCFRSTHKRSMTIETKFWKIITQLGAFPLLVVWPLVLYLIYPSVSGADQWIEWLMVALLLRAYILSYGLWGLIKLIYHKPRPNGQTYDNRWRKIAAWSMPSVHTSNAIITILTFLYGLLMTTSWRNWLLSVPFVALVVVIIVNIAVIISRIELKRHHAIDTIAGMMFGVLIFFVAAISFIYPFVALWRFYMLLFW